MEQTQTLRTQQDDLQKPPSHLLGGQPSRDRLLALYPLQQSFPGKARIESGLSRKLAWHLVRLFLPFRVERLDFQPHKQIDKQSLGLHERPSHRLLPKSKLSSVPVLPCNLRSGLWNECYIHAEARVVGEFAK